MTEAVEALGEAFAEVEIDLSVAGSQVLVAQVREGAPLDVVITADAATARSLADLELLAASPVPFARNRLAIAVAAGNPLDITGLDDLADDQITLILASPEVPAGAYTRQLLERAGVKVSPDSLEPSVRAVLAKIQLGEADAGVVYQTDLRAGGVSGVVIPQEANVSTEYFVAVIDRDKVETATGFATFLQTAEAQGILAGLGFQP